MAIKVGINGFGRIGRCILRMAIDNSDMEFVAVNDVTDATTLAHLLKYDSVHGNFEGKVEAREDAMVVNGKTVRITAKTNPAELPWKELGVQVVVESTGRFTDKASASRHIEAGAAKVIISAPAKNEDITIVMGVNDNKYDPAKHHIISNASCTSNALAPVVKVLYENFGLKKGLMTTIHSYTNDQRILDLPHKDLRRARAAALSMIPTTTGAARAISLVMPELKGKLDGLAIRVPTPNVSLVDLVAELERQTTVEEVNGALKKASLGELKGYLKVSEEELVSCDFNNSHFSSIVDGPITTVIGGSLVKVLAWYDNETGYSCRILDLIRLIAKSL